MIVTPTNMKYVHLLPSSPLELKTPGIGFAPVMSFIGAFCESGQGCH